MVFAVSKFGSLLLQGLTSSLTLGTLLGVIGLFGGILTWRDSQFRKQDVYNWTNRVIVSLESLLILCIYGEDLISPEEGRKRLTDAMFDTAVLVEQGRLLFRNRPDKDYGADKLPAYRGHRPLILDPIVLAHKIACHLAASPDEETKLRYRCVAEDQLKIFVSLAQSEVGRSRAVSHHAAKAGKGLHLHELVDNVDPSRMADLRSKAAR